MGLAEGHDLIVWRPNKTLKTYPEFTQQVRNNKKKAKYSGQNSSH